MGITKDIQKATEDYRASIEALLERFKELIDNLPENDKIKPLTASIFVMNYSDLDSSNWSPEYYRFRWQYNKVYEVLSQMIDKTKIAGRLEKIIEERKIVVQHKFSGRSMWNYSETYKLHPEVVKNLKTIL